jgi:hypothetical protein
MTHTTSDMTPAELRKFGLVTGAIIILFIGAFVPWWWDKNILQWQQVTLPLWWRIDCLGTGASCQHGLFLQAVDETG